MHVCVCIYIYSYCLLGDFFMLKYYTVVLFVELYVNVVFVTSCLYSTVSLTQVREWRFIGIIYYYYYYMLYQSIKMMMDALENVIFIRGWDIHTSLTAI